MPCPGAEEIAFGNFEHRCALRICGVEIHRIAPPRLDCVDSNVSILWVLQTEENEDRTDCDPRIQSRRKHVVVFRPPREVASADNILEDESNNSPGDVVDGAGRGDVPSSGENDWEVDVSEPAVRVL